MRPGEDCLSNCHDGTAAQKFTAAGTIFGGTTAAGDAGVEGVTVIITGADSVETRLTTNAAGNFYTTAAVAKPFSLAVERGTRREQMQSTSSSGACASCHTVPPANNAPGRIYVSP